MLNFSGRDQKAQEVCLYYVDKLGAENLKGILQSSASVTSQDEALQLSKFFWKMLDASIADRDNDVEVLGETDLQFWMERSMNIISGYLSKIGYDEEWEKATDEA